MFSRLLSLDHLLYHGLRVALGKGKASLASRATSRFEHGLGGRTSNAKEPCQAVILLGLTNYTSEKSGETENLPDDEEAGSDPDGGVEDISPLRWILKMRHR